MVRIPLIKVTQLLYRPGVARRVGRGIALLFHDLGTRRGWGVSVTPRPHFTPGKDPVPTVQGAGWATGPVRTGAENLVPTGIRSRTVQPVGSRYTATLPGPYVLYWTYLYLYLMLLIFPVIKHVKFSCYGPLITVNTAIFARSLLLTWMW
jgi:hypothetical protein